MIGPADIQSYNGAEEEPTGLLEQLQLEHPELKQYLDEVQDAHEEGDEIDLQEAVAKLLQYLTHGMNVAYPKLTKSERKRAGEKIATNIREGKYKTRAQAIAVGLRQGAPGKYKTFERKRRRSR